MQVAALGIEFEVAYLRIGRVRVVVNNIIRIVGTPVVGKPLGCEKAAVWAVFKNLDGSAFRQEALSVSEKFFYLGHDLFHFGNTVSVCRTNIIVIAIIIIAGPVG